MSAFFLGHPTETDLALFAGGESGPFARWRIERHVERCPQCQEIAADFFRLPDQLNELAELPSVDWKQMAAAIEAGVLADAATVQRVRRSGFPPLVWQAGLAAATVAVAVIVLRAPDHQPQSEPGLVAMAPMEAPAPVALERESAAQVAEQDVAAPEPVRSSPPVVAEAEAPLAKAREERQAFASDVAAPAAPPPPPSPVQNAATSKRSMVVAEEIAPAAESAEGRLRSDAASRVGAVAALGSAQPTAVADRATAFRQTRVAWAQLPVETINFDGAPLNLSSGSTAFAGSIAKTPTVAATNRSGRTVSSFELKWIVGDADASATTRFERQGVSMAPGAVNASGGDRSWRLPSGIVSAKMRVYVSRVTFDDGTNWAPTAAEIAGRGLIEPGAAYPQLELLPPNFELDDRP